MDAGLVVSFQVTDGHNISTELVKMLVASSSIDGFPFVGAVPGRAGHFIAAGFTGHGMLSPPS